MEVLYDYYTYNFRLYFPVKGHICVYKHQKHHKYDKAEFYQTILPDGSKMHRLSGTPRYCGLRVPILGRTEQSVRDCPLQPLKPPLSTKHYFHNCLDDITFIHIFAAGN